MQNCIWGGSNVTNEVVLLVLIGAVTLLNWALLWLNYRWNVLVKKIRKTADEAIQLNEEQSKHVADLQTRLHAAYGVLVSIAHAPLPADDKVAMCAAFLQNEGVSGTVEVRVEAPPASSIH